MEKYVELAAVWAPVVLAVFVALHAAVLAISKVTDNVKDDKVAEKLGAVVEFLKKFTFFKSSK